MARSARKSRDTRSAPTAAIPGVNPKTESVGFTLEEALAESGETIEELTAEPTEAEKPTRPAGTSNLALTIRAHRKNYSVALHPVNGKKTQNNGDTVARLLLNIPLAKLKDYSAGRFATGARDGRYDHLNEGHSRMCIGNLIRAAVNKNEQDVLIWLMANQPSDEPVVPAEAEAEEA